MKPTKDPVWNREYVNQRLRDKRMDAAMREIVERPTADESASYWFLEFLAQQQRVTELETENAKMRVILNALLRGTPTSRTVSITEVF